MQKPPPDQETVKRNLIQFRENYARNSLNDIEFLDDAIKALDKPQTVEQLSESLEKQSSIVDALGWSGIASNMRAASRKLLWYVNHNFDWREGLRVENEKDLGKALCQFVEKHRDKLENYQIDLFGRVARDLTDKPETKKMPGEIATLSVYELLCRAQFLCELAQRHAVFPNRQEDVVETLRLAKKTAEHLSTVVEKLGG